MLHIRQVRHPLHPHEDKSNIYSITLKNIKNKQLKLIHRISGWIEDTTVYNPPPKSPLLTWSKNRNQEILVAFKNQTELVKFLKSVNYLTSSLSTLPCIMLLSLILTGLLMFTTVHVLPMNSTWPWIKINSHNLLIKNFVHKQFKYPIKCSNFVDAISNN